MSADFIPDNILAELKEIKKGGLFWKYLDQNEDQSVGLYEFQMAIDGKKASNRKMKLDIIRCRDCLPDPKQIGRYIKFIGGVMVALGIFIESGWTLNGAY